jgi:hypothetical protein
VLCDNEDDYDSNGRPVWRWFHLLTALFGVQFEITPDHPLLSPHIYFFDHAIKIAL